MEKGLLSGQVEAPKHGAVHEWVQRERLDAADQERADFKGVVKHETLEVRPPPALGTVVVSRHPPCFPVR